MAIPKSYLTSVKNVRDIFKAMQTAQAPPKFTVRFLESLGFKTPADRLIIGVLKSLNFLNANGEPTKRYFEFLDQTQANRVLAEALREGYSDLFQINTKANELSQADIKNKLRTLTQGQASDTVLDKMAATFKTLSGMADFSSAPSKTAPDTQAKEKEEKQPQKTADKIERIAIGGLVYNIQLILPESRDQSVYDALFKSMKDHLLR